MSGEDKWRAHYEWEHGLKITHVCPKTNNVIMAKCKFCLRFGVEDTRAPDAKRAKKGTKSGGVHEFKSFRPRNLRLHAQNMHPTRYAEFMELTDAEKKKYFDAPTTRVKRTLLQHFKPANGKPYLYFEVSRDIVEKIIGGLFYSRRDDDDVMHRIDDSDSERDSDDEDEIGPILLAARLAAKKAALSLFDRKPNEDGYSVTIKSPGNFGIAIDLVARGHTFRGIQSSIEVFKMRTPHPDYSGLNRLLVSRYTRTVVAFGLQLIADALADPSVWTFGMACDGSSLEYTSYFDVRIRFCRDGKLQNLHVAALPQESKGAYSTTCLVSTLLDSLYADWRYKLLGFSTDGENTMTGRHSGVATRMQGLAKFTIVRVWCAAHQIDLKVRYAVEKMACGRFYSVLHRLSVYLRKQENLIREMLSKCPRDTNRWSQLVKMLEWLLKHRHRIVEYLEEKKVDWIDEFWWEKATIVHCFLRSVNHCIVKLQARDLDLGQQEAAIRELSEDLRTMTKVVEADSAPAPSDDSDDDNGDDSDDDSDVFTKGKFSIKRTDVLDFMSSQGEFLESFVTELSIAESLPHRARDDFDLDDANHHVHQVARFCLSMIEGVACVAAERAADNTPSPCSLPKVLPKDFVQLETRIFMRDVMGHQAIRERLVAGWTDEATGESRMLWTVADREGISSEHTLLREKYRRDPVFKEAISKQDDTTPFDVAWSTCCEEFPSLYRFAGGVASVLPSTTTVESDFSTLKRTKNCFRASLTPLSVEGHFHCHQFSANKVLGFDI